MVSQPVMMKYCVDVVSFLQNRDHNKNIRDFKYVFIWHTLYKSIYLVKTSNAIFTSYSPSHMQTCIKILKFFNVKTLTQVCK